MSLQNTTELALDSAAHVTRAYLQANPSVTSAAAVEFFSRICRTLVALGADLPPLAAQTVMAVPLPVQNTVGRLEPFLPVDESISEDRTVIYCLVDGKPLKMLKRYIKRFGMTPESYREAFGLPPDYPMTAPAYSEVKRCEALEVGLGTAGNKAGMPRRAPVADALQERERELVAA